MDWTHLLFSFRGRINRAKYWLVAAISVAIAIVAVLLAFALPGTGLIVLVAVVLALVYIGVTVGAKRLHDRDKSAWWLLLFYLAPAALQWLGEGTGMGAELALNLAAIGISIWAIVELGFLRGTIGPNEYGPDPLEQKF